jgi:hypothetical protein
MAAVYQSLHTCLLEGFPVSHHQDLAVGIAIHHLPIAIILTFFINSHLHKKAIFALCSPCINDSTWDVSI